MNGRPRIHISGKKQKYKTVIIMIIILCAVNIVKLDRKYENNAYNWQYLYGSGPRP